MRAKAPSGLCGLCVCTAPATQSPAQGPQGLLLGARGSSTHTPLTPPPRILVGSFLPSSPSLIPCFQHSFILDCHPHHGTSMCLLAGHPMQTTSQPHEPINVDCLFLSISLLLEEAFFLAQRNSASSSPPQNLVGVLRSFGPSSGPVLCVLPTGAMFSAPAQGWYTQEVQCLWMNE